MAIRIDFVAMMLLAATHPLLGCDQIFSYSSSAPEDGVTSKADGSQDADAGNRPPTDAALVDTVFPHDEGVSGDTRGAVCAEGACWQRPLPQGNTLRGIWGASRDSLVMVGLGGTILHYTRIDAKWEIQRAKSGTDKDLYAVWGAAANQIYAVGDEGTILRFNGSKWTSWGAPATSAGLRAVWGAQGQVYAVGKQGHVVRCEGQGCEIEHTIAGGGTYNAIWGRDLSDIYVAGPAGQVYHRGVSGLWHIEQGPTDAIYGIWGDVTTGDVYLGGESCSVWHYHSEWINKSKPSCSYKFNAVWGAGPNRVYFVGNAPTVMWLEDAQWGGAKISPPADPLYALWGADAQTVFAAGQYGSVMYRHDDVDWISLHPRDSRNKVNAIWSDGATYVAVGSNGRLWQRTNGNWAEMQATWGWALYGIAGQSTNDLHVVGHNISGRFDGNWSWNIDMGMVLKAVWSTPTKTFAVGDGGVVAYKLPGDLKFKEIVANPVPTFVNLNGIDGVGDKAIIVGDNGKAWRFDVDTHQLTLIPTSTQSHLLAVRQTSATDALIVGTEGTVLRAKCNTSDAKVTSNQTLGAMTLNAVSAEGNTYFIVGDDGTVFSSVDGLSWVRGNWGTGNDLAAVWVSPDEVLVGGEGGALLSKPR